MSVDRSDSERETLASKVAAVLSKEQEGIALSTEDNEVLLVAAFRYLEEHGHEIPPERLPSLPDDQQKALESMRKRAVSRALDLLRQGEDPQPPGHSR